MINVEQNKAIFKEIVKSMISRDGIDDLMNWLETTDFYTAPSSARYHGSEPGGLCAHSLKVYECLRAKQVDETGETIAIAALFHDLCKVNTYKLSMRNTKDEATGKWIKVPYYEYRDDDVMPFGHGEKSMYIVMKYIKLTDEEALAIRWHMGFSAVEPIYEKPQLTAALQLYQLVLKLQTADTEASHWFNT